MGAGQSARSAGDEIVVALRSRRRQRAAIGQKLQHLIPAAGLLFSGVQSLMAGVEGFERVLALVGIGTSALLMGAFGRHLRTRREPPAEHGSHGVDWMDIWAAGVLFAEAAEKWRIRGHIWRPETLAAMATLGVGLFHGRLAARKERQRSLHVTPVGVVVGRRFFGTFRAPWHEIAEIAIGEHQATIRTNAGRVRRLNLADLENAPDVRAALHAAEERLVEHRSAQRFLPLPN